MNEKEIREQFEKYCVGDVAQYWSSTRNNYSDKNTRNAWESHLRCIVINGLADDSVNMTYAPNDDDIAPLTVCSRTKCSRYNPQETNNCDGFERIRQCAVLKKNIAKEDEVWEAMVEMDKGNIKGDNNGE